MAQRSGAASSRGLVRTGLLSGLRLGEAKAGEMRDLRRRWSTRRMGEGQGPGRIGGDW